MKTFHITISSSRPSFRLLCDNAKETFPIYSGHSNRRLNHRRDADRGLTTARIQ
jgi:hypothetical protein